MLGIVLVAVGFVLFHNAWFGLSSKGVAKSGNTLSVVNFMGGAIILIIGILEVTAGNYFSAAIYILVGLTYLYIGFDHVFGLDPKAFGVFCLTGAIALFIGGVLTIQGWNAVDAYGQLLNEPWQNVWLLICWFSWAFLWFILFVECAMEKKFGKLTPVICLLTTFYTGWIPGIMMLAGWW